MNLKFNQMKKIRLKLADWEETCDFSKYFLSHLEILPIKIPEKKRKID